jgi:hypothetical protein
LALYRALHSINWTAMLVAAALVGVFVVVDLAVTWANYAALLMRGARYAAATTDAQRASYVAAANYPATVLASPLERVYAIAILSFAILLIGLVMFKSAFGKVTALLAVITGILGIISITGWSVTIVMNAVFATRWVLVVGYQLLRLSRR